LPASVPRLPTAPAPGNGRTPIPHAPQAAPSAPEIFITAPLAVLSESWPEVLRGEIEQLNLSEAHLALPVRVVEPALKQGKVAFPWKVLRSWIRPATLPTVSAHDGMMLELPLQVIAPLFIARQKQAGQKQQKLQINESIPNLFFGFPQGDAAAEVAAAPAPVAPPAPAAPVAEEPEANFAPAPKQKPGVLDTNFYVWNESGETPAVDETEFKRKPSTGPGTDFLSRYATPNEVISQAAALEGVAGALVALPDGLMVASKLSPDLNGDTLAAFLPHIFGKVSQCTKELRMGELNNLHFTVGNVPWKIFRVNAIFFAAFGNPGQPLPTAQLAALAGQLDRKK
jgi:predicted regulator of Ras-like GTPase activity (Roadblock/LC7/MglB family)